MFTTPTLVSFGSDDINNRTVMEIVASDRPGLLCQIGQVLRNHEVGIQAAKILTVGERAEDVFYVTRPGWQSADRSRMRTARSRPDPGPRQRHLNACTANHSHNNRRNPS